MKEFSSKGYTIHFRFKTDNSLFVADLSLDSQDKPVNLSLNDGGVNIHPSDFKDFGIFINAIIASEKE